MKIFFSIMFSTLLFGEFGKTYNGFGIDIGTNGSGIFITRQILHDSEKFSLNGELRFYDIKSSTETYAYNLYTGQYESTGGKSLFMTPFLFGINYYPFVGKIENNFSPFITARFGGVLSVDGNETGSFKERWKDPDTQINQGAFIGLGIDFEMVGQTSVSVMLGLEILPLKYEFDDMDDYSGSLIHISFNRRSK